MSEPSPPGKELAVPQPAANAGPAAPRDLSWLRDRLRSITWTPRSAAGAGLFVAGLFLLPFAGWPWLPVVIGLGVLVLLRLLRLDGLMRGWAPRVAGAVIIALLLARTSPWVWALGLSLGIVVAGLLRLPRWHVVAVGAALLLVSGIGYGFTLQAKYAAAQIQRDDEYQVNRGGFLVEKPEGIIRAMMLRIAFNDSATACSLLSDPGRKQFADSVRAPDCQSAVGRLAAMVTDQRRYSEPVVLPSALTKTANKIVVDGCVATWSPGGADPGPKIGRFDMRLVEGARSGYEVTGYSGCP